MIENISKILKKKVIHGKDIGLLFPGWNNEECVVVVGAHDDDPLIGAGLLIHELRLLGTKVYVLIVTDGRKGYCKTELKGRIVSIRKKETEEAYAYIGIDNDHIIRFDLPDSALFEYAYKWETEENKDDGLIYMLIKTFRKIRATRFILPNENDFHLAHQAVFHASLYSAIQASQRLYPDVGEPINLKSVMRCGVWSPFKNNPSHGFKSSEEAFQRKMNGLFCYKSQEQIDKIIAGLKERGPFEYFQEYLLEGFPADKYNKYFWEPIKNEQRK